MARIALAIGFAILGALTFGLGAFAGLGASAIFAGGAGSALFGASLGFTVGSALGAVLFPVKLPNQVGPRLNDLTVSSSTNGSPIPIGYGAYRFAGNIIWSPGLVETAKTTKMSAKGGPSYSSTTYTYTASFACAFGESFGLTPGNWTGNILKVWFDSKIAYDGLLADSGSWQANHAYLLGESIVDSNGNLETVIQAGTSGSSEPTWPTAGESTNDPSGGGAGAVIWAESLTSTYAAPTIYNGTNMQNPDPLIQGDEGVALTPGFRGLIYAVWENFLLTDWGNRIPNIQALVQFGVGISGIPTATPLGDIIRDLCQRAGLDYATQVDVSQINGGI